MIMPLTPLWCPPLAPGWYKIVEPQFSYNVLGEYPPADETPLINQVWIDTARSRWDLFVIENGQIPPPYTKARVGFDLAEFGSDSNVLCFKYGNYVEPLISWSGMDIIKSCGRAAAACVGMDESGRIEVMKRDEMWKMRGRSPDRADSLCLSFAQSGSYFDDIL